MPKPVKQNLAKHLKSKGVTSVKKPTVKPLWEGPCGGGPNGGVTQSLIASFLCDRERFRVRTIEGLRVIDTFNHRLSFGNMFHVCCEEWARTNGKGDDWVRALLDYSKKLASKYRTQQSEVQKWYTVCKLLFPVYIKYWKKHPDVVNRKPLLEEYTFRVPYALPSERVVWLRGKWDSVDQVIEKKKGAIWLQENKSKSDPNEQDIRRQLTNDLQSMTYLTALEILQQQDGAPSLLAKFPIAGVRYNVVRRPLSGGKGSIRQRKPTKSNPLGETTEEYYGRLLQYIVDDPENYFKRWNVEVTTTDIQRFKQRTLTPILEQMCDWFEWITAAPDAPFRESEHGIHFQFPLGIYNPLTETGHTDLDSYIESGNMAGLHKVETLFRELEE